MATVNITSNAQLSAELEGGNLQPSTDYVVTTAFNRDEALTITNSPAIEAQRTTIDLSLVTIRDGGILASYQKYLTFISPQIDGQNWGPTSTMERGIEVDGSEWVFITDPDVRNIWRTGINGRTATRLVITNPTMYRVGDLVSADDHDDGECVYLVGGQWCKVIGGTFNQTSHTVILMKHVSSTYNSKYNIVRGVTCTPRWTDGIYDNKTNRAISCTGLGNLRDNNLVEACKMYDYGSRDDNEKATIEWEGRNNLWRFNQLYCNHTGTTANAFPCFAALSTDRRPNPFAQSGTLQSAFVHNTIGLTAGDVSGIELIRNTSTAALCYELEIENNIFDLSGSGINQILDVKLDSDAPDLADSSFKNNVCWGGGQSPTVMLDNPAFNSTLSALEGTARYETSVSGNINEDPLLNNPAALDFTLQGGSPAKGASKPSTYTTSGSSQEGTVIQVQSALQFKDAHGWDSANLTGDASAYAETPDTITIGGVARTLTADGVDKVNHTLTVTVPLSWSAGAEVRLVNTPDIGAEQTAANPIQAFDDSGYTVSNGAIGAQTLSTLHPAGAKPTDNDTGSWTSIFAVTPGSADYTAAIVGTDDLSITIVNNAFVGTATLLYQLDDGSGPTATAFVKVEASGETGDAKIVLSENADSGTTIGTKAPTVDVNSIGTWTAYGSDSPISGGVITPAAADDGFGGDTGATEIDFSYTSRPNASGNYSILGFRGSGTPSAWTGYSLTTIPSASNGRLLLKRHEGDNIRTGGATLADPVFSPIPFTRDSTTIITRVVMTNQDIEISTNVDGAGFTSAYNHLDTGSALSGTLGVLISARVGSTPGTWDDIEWWDLDNVTADVSATIGNVDFDGVDEALLSISRNDDWTTVPTGAVGVGGVPPGTGLLKQVTLNDDGSVSIFQVQGVTNCSVRINNGVIEVKDGGVVTGTSGTMTFRVTIRGDDTGGTDSAIITVDFANTAPVVNAVTPPAITMSKGQTVYYNAATGQTLPANVGTNEPAATDAEGDDIAYGVSTALDNGVTLTDLTSNIFSLVHDDVSVGDATVAMTITDDTGSGGQAGTPVSLPVEVLPAYQAIDDTVSCNINSSGNIFDVLANDLNKTAPSITAVKTAEGGTVGQSVEGGTVTTDGATVTYTPATGFFGTDSFWYETTDSGETEGATVTVTVLTDEITLDIENIIITVDRVPNLTVSFQVSALPSEAGTDVTYYVDDERDNFSNGEWDIGVSTGNIVATFADPNAPGPFYFYWVGYSETGGRAYRGTARVTLEAADRPTDTTGGTGTTAVRLPATRVPATRTPAVRTPRT